MTTQFAHNNTVSHYCNSKTYQPHKHHEARDHHKVVYFGAEDEFYKHIENQDIAHLIAGAVSIAVIDAFEAHIRAIYRRATFLKNRHWHERYSLSKVAQAEQQKHLEHELRRELEHIVVKEITKIGHFRGLDSFVVFEAKVLALWYVHLIAGERWGANWVHHLANNVAKDEFGLALIYDFEGIWGRHGHPGHAHYYHPTHSDKQHYENIQWDLDHAYFFGYLLEYGKWEREKREWLRVGKEHNFL